ncbi:MAG: hypothetical protein ABI865_05895, partial [Nitrosospira sp.]
VSQSFSVTLFISIQEGPHGDGIRKLLKVARFYHMTVDAKLVTADGILISGDDVMITMCIVFTPFYAPQNFKTAHL